MRITIGSSVVVPSEEATSRSARRTIAAASPPVTNCWPEYRKAFGLTIPCSFPNATALPENDTAPITRPRSVATVTPKSGIRPESSSRENSRIDTSAAAPPPAPLNRATICGIAVIFTTRAPANPATPPTAMPARINGTLPWTSAAKNVAMTAMSMPVAAMRFP